ncbi:adenosylcobinamide-GDP ribazoletransferase [Sporosarcina gallistercoris]|uniref:Adenosylcobinamide-GDP ribazoletransferase n=1 Tax=Sporosarcina gallistercoris TaxID=2762245 RepID=A0ABR8PM15_9BACL|nr:adenosylcobinamide-GDP ribazoletransferase [Sporosarcina gallistercoris]MBD7909208.1 adenosylcobinamide-GDP ribazoletransferase [Sporosarcina gallistercoris]
MNGILLALQFFTSIPVRKELPMERRHITAMYGALPFVGALVGLAMTASILLSEWLGFGSILASVLTLVVGIALTGGLHLDGVADTSDAYFSFRDQKRRHEILADPRIGAFGTLGLIVFILLKFALLQELIATGQASVYVLVAVPFLARGAMVLYFVSTKPAKTSGMAVFFLEKLNRKPLIVWTIVCISVGMIAMGKVLETAILPIVMAGLIGVSLLLYRSWTVRNFGGVTGDLSGAFIEGMEVVLWFAVLSSL